VYFYFTAQGQPALSHPAQIPKAIFDLFILLAHHMIILFMQLIEKQKLRYILIFKLSCRFFVILFRSFGLTFELT